MAGDGTVQKAGVNQKVLAELNAAKQVHIAGNIAEAESRYRTLLARNPTLHDALHPLGIALQQLGRHAEAETIIARWLSHAPQDADALVNHGNSLLALGRASEAAGAYQRALSLRPQSPEIRCFLANAFYAQGDAAGAEENYRLVLKEHPGAAMALFNLANILCDTGRADDGIAVYEEALRHHPGMVEAMVNLGNQLSKRGRGEEAITLLRKATQLRPDLAEAHINLGSALYDVHNDLEGAASSFREAVRLVPTHPDGLNNLANTYMNMGRAADAEEIVRRALRHHPLSPSIHGTAAGLFLGAGKLEEGWAHFEWRWLRPNLPVPLRDFGKPEWQGEDISTKTILLHHEQGLGDSIQFVRFVADVAARARQVILEVPPNLRALYGCLLKIEGVTLATYGEPVPPFDVHLAIMSVPFVLGTTLATIPAPIPYLFADPQRVEMWRDRLPPGGFRIGIVWQGKAGVGIDRGRSYGLHHLAAVARVPGVTLVSLQKGYGLDQLENLPDGMRVETLGPDFDAGADAFLDTAAVMQHMDLIISSDTSVAHLAGALGRPVWVPLKLSPDWRWLTDREDSPWYPHTMRLFRQRQPGDWPQVFDRLAAEVAALKDGDRSRLLPPPPPGPAPAETYPPVSRPPLPRYMPPVLLKQAPEEQVSAGLRQAATRTGPMWYLGTDQFIGRSLELYGEWSVEEALVCQSVLRPGDIVVEAGANIGAHTLLLANAVGPQGHVHAFEPQKRISDVLTLNLQANKNSNVSVHPVAVGAEIGTLYVPRTDYDQRGNFGGISLHHAGDGDQVDVVTIDSLNVPHLRLLKADVEGMEMAVLDGAVGTIQRCRPFLYFEYGANVDTARMLEKIHSLGYRCWRHKSLIYNPDNFKKNPDNLFPKVVSLNIFCAPAEIEIVVVGMPEITPKTS
ncbi:hypothetical protein CHU95_19910 [Niveispirillum lacus]|uniref:Methyltransferase FkbM domain-containing protein n=1 Tax=Niveispirillum lacus TaxID=1981099 RepID=A0A255YQD5_9PROT|nr:FkbM family methyltransferase [Niveispirillum lacus]OYQ31419.1 hypothetical protein CHU95_19910 [Niveispirillum lacus]